jgi:anti-anti-sigma factor
VGDVIVVIVAIVAGELDLATVPRVRAHLRDTTGGRPGHVVLDLAGVRLMSSHGVSLLIDAHEGRDGIHGRLHRTGVSSNRPVRRVLDLTGLTLLLDIQDDQDDLVRKLARCSPTQRSEPRVEPVGTGTAGAPPGVHPARRRSR